MNNYNELLKYTICDSEAECIEAVIKTGSPTEAAKLLDVNPRTVTRKVARIKSRAAIKGYSPDHNMTHTVPDGFKVKGVSTFYDEEGNPIRQWVKSTEDSERREQLIQEAIKAATDSIPRTKAIKPPKHTDSDLANLYTITDYHLGMMSWHEETGEDWDTGIAEDLLVNWFGAAIASSPQSEVGIFAQLGDFLHWDGLDAVTPANKHILDADTRFQKVVRITIRVIRRVIAMLLKKHDQVYVIMAEGNHDPASSIWLRELLTALYEDEPRVEVNNSVDPYYCYEHGLTSLFFHHGHKKRIANIDDVFASKFREVFGRTKFSYAHMGHLHHVDVKETNLMIIEQHRTLAAPDAYASRGGWMSGRDAQVITYHKEYGQVGRVVISPDMVN
jgi:hypothetical protein